MTIRFGNFFSMSRFLPASFWVSGWVQFIRTVELNPRAPST
jgi:hypothetical protein